MVPSIPAQEPLATICFSLFTPAIWHTPDHLSRCTADLLRRGKIFLLTDFSKGGQGILRAEVKQDPVCVSEFP